MYCSKCGKEIENCNAEKNWGYCEDCELYTKLDTERGLIETPNFTSMILVLGQVFLLIFMLGFYMRIGWVEIDVNDKEYVLGAFIIFSIVFLMSLIAFVIETCRKKGWFHFLQWFGVLVVLNFPFWIFISDTVRAYLQ